MAFIDTLTAADIKALKATILGTDATGVDSAAEFVTEGSDYNKTHLATDEKVIARLLNSLKKNETHVFDNVDDYRNRFSSVVGKEYSEDQEAFESIGMNLIQAIAQLKQSGGGGFIGDKYYWETVTVGSGVGGGGDNGSSGSNCDCTDKYEWEMVTVGVGVGIGCDCDGKYDWETITEGVSVGIGSGDSSCDCNGEYDWETINEGVGGGSNGIVEIEVYEHTFE